jgi:hypothetical protein
VCLANLGSEWEKCVGSRVRLVGVSISFEKNFYWLPFTPPSLVCRISPSQRTRLASLGSMDPQTSDQPTLGNGQHFIYTKEHASECMTRRPRAGRTKGSGRTSLMQQTDPQPPSNRLRDQITDAQLVNSLERALIVLTPRFAHRVAQRRSGACVAVPRGP